MSYRNKFEEQTAEALNANNVPFLYEDTKIPYTISGTYLVDFKIITNSGKIIFIETKGNGRSFDHACRKKMISVKEQHPDIDLRIVFYSDGKIGPKRKDGTYMRQMEWAKKYGFDASVKEIPLEWLQE